MVGPHPCPCPHVQPVLALVFPSDPSVFQTAQLRSSLAIEGSGAWLVLPQRAGAMCQPFPGADALSRATAQKFCVFWQTSGCENRLNGQERSSFVRQRPTPTPPQAPPLWWFQKVHKFWLQD